MKQKILLNDTTEIDLPKLIESRLLVQANSGAASSIMPGHIVFEIDHILPESKGGTLILDNLQLLCHNVIVGKE